MTQIQEYVATIALGLTAVALSVFMYTQLQGALLPPIV
jgi:hypothetical protein